MKISLITVTYNSAKTLQETIDSIRSQTYNDIEHIIIDGNSKDETLNIIKKNTSISKYVSEPDDGLYFAMNKGLSIASGDVIGILNSDDVYSNKEVISSVVNFFKINRSVDAVYGDLCYVKEDNLSKVVRYWKSGAYDRQRFRRGWMPPHPTIFFKKEVYHKYGNFNTALRSASDYEIMLRFLYKNKVTCGYLPKVMVLMRMGGNSNQSFSHRIKANKEDQFAWKVNDLKMPVLLRFFKPFRKLLQYIHRP